ncbi:uncharacterized protein LOC129407474 [Boleophthalmus pectinirostris]|uniref:uncharacterized protein LOC129407474 n=1 Tax=Boleophthalmus pectinirostris TaxID=150288 RepID=UPI00242D9FA8|nr:uncharacterized protein LOC129407474 [Boleophthalmus pectinirostris]
MTSDLRQASMMQQADVVEGPADPSVLLNSIGVNVKVCKELLVQIQASLDRVEARRGQSQRTRSVQGPSHSAAGRAVGPPSACYTLFRLLPQDSEWAKNLERQLRTHTYELLPKEQLEAALRFLTEGPTEECTLYQTAEGPTQGPSMCQCAEHLSAEHLSAEYVSAEYQSAEGSTEGPTLYQSVLDFSLENTQEQQLRGGAQMQDLSDCRCPGESSEEGPPSSLPPSMALLHIEEGDISSITHSPPPHQKIHSLLFKRHLAPCNSTPRSTGVQLISDISHLVSSPYASQSYCTAGDKSANLSQPNSYPVVRAAAREQHQRDRDLEAGMKRAQEELLFESERTAEGEGQGTAEGEAKGTAEGEGQGTAEGESQGTAEGEAQGTAEGESEGAVEGEAKGTAESRAQGTTEGEAPGTAEGEAQGTVQGKAQATAEEESERTAAGESERTAAGESERTAAGESERRAAGDFKRTTAGESERTAGEAQEGEVNTKAWGLASHHQLYMNNMGIRSHLTLDNEPDSAEKDSALVCKVVSRAESREGQEPGKSLPGTRLSEPSEVCCSPHEQGEPQWASLLTDSYRAHSTLDDILQAHLHD